MRRFAALHRVLDEPARAGEREASLVAYFREAPAEDAAWALSFLTGGRPPRAVSAAALEQWAAEVADLPLWLVEASRRAVSDRAETVALLVAAVPREEREWPLHRLVVERLLPLAAATAEEKRSLLVATWRELPAAELLTFCQLASGTFKPGVSIGAVSRALAEAMASDAGAIAQRLAEPWTPSAAAFRSLSAGTVEEGAAARSYPFHLAAPLAGEPDELPGGLAAWRAEWHWAGARAQLVRREAGPLLWSRAGELITASYPAVAEAAEALPAGTVLDGQLLRWDDSAPRAEVPESARPSISYLAYDLLELGGVDLRSRPLDERRAALRELVASLREPRLLLSPLLEAASWQELRALLPEARARQAVGLLLKRRDSTYAAGREEGAWRKWSAAPLTVEAVLLYAQRGEGGRGSDYRDYTFAVWHEGELVSVAKASGGLPPREIEELDRWVRRHIVESFGPVRQLVPELVFELAFDAVEPSGRHKAGLVLRNPRVLRWLRDRAPAEAAHLAHLRARIPGAAGSVDGR